MEYFRVRRNTMNYDDLFLLLVLTSVIVCSSGITSVLIMQKLIQYHEDLWQVIFNFLLYFLLFVAIYSISIFFIYKLFQLIIPLVDVW